MLLEQNGGCDPKSLARVTTGITLALWAG
jgi:hypothetical protein